MRQCSSLDEVRSCIDDVDRQLVKLLAARRGFVLQAAAFKKTDADVRAPARVEQVIAKVRGLAGAEGIEPELVEALYRQMIEGFIAIEHAARRGGQAPAEE
jgi:chorismate mutase